MQRAAYLLAAEAAGEADVLDEAAPIEPEAAVVDEDAVPEAAVDEASADDEAAGAGAGAGAGAAAGAGAGAGAGASDLLQAARAMAAIMDARTSDFFISGFLLGVGQFRKNGRAPGRLRG